MCFRFCSWSMRVIAVIRDPEAPGKIIAFLNARGSGTTVGN